MRLSDRNRRLRHRSVGPAEGSDRSDKLTYRITTSQNRKEKPVNKPTREYGPYAVGDKEYSLAPLTNRRYQAFIRVFTSLPLTLLYQAWSDLQAALEAKVPADFKERLKKGEITKEEFDQMKMDL